MREEHPRDEMRPMAWRSVNVARADDQMYRPGLAVAAMLILLPALVALVAVGLALIWGQRVPLALPLALVPLLPAIAGSWLGIVSVRIGPGRIAAGRPLRPWREITWVLVEHARQRGPRVTLIASDGQRLRFIPALLHDGGRLRREILVRLPTQVLDERMASEARMLLAEHILPTAEGGLTGSLHARPRGRWRAVPLAVAAAAVVAGGMGVMRLPLPLSLGGVLLAGLALAGAVVMFGWCAQVLDASDAGLTVRYPLRRGSAHIAWGKVQLVEHSPGEHILRLRGEGRLVCAGPALLRPPERDLLRAFLHAYCVNRGVPVARRRWLLWGFSARGVRHV